MDDFKKLTPKTLGYCLDGEELRKKRHDSEMWSWWGNYGISAVMFAIEHCLNGRNAKSKYINKPVTSQDERKDTFTDADIQKAIISEQQYMIAAQRKGLPETIIK